MTGRMQTLAKLALERGWTSGAELGVWQGATSRYLMEHCPALSLVAVDRWERVPGPPKNMETGEVNWAEKDMEGAEAMARAVLADYPNRLTIIKGDTADAARIIKPNSLDFIFVDADHTTAAVVRDVQAWRPKVRPGGMILGHDADWPSVARARQILGFDHAAILPGNIWAVPQT